MIESPTHCILHGLKPHLHSAHNLLQAHKSSPHSAHNMLHMYTYGSKHVNLYQT
jgi:hypothetical protein